MKKLSKLLFIIVFIILFTLSFSFKIKADDIVFYSIKASVGETADSIGIIYHTNVENSTVKISKNSNMTSSITITPVVHEWSKAKVKNDDNTGFKSRYVCLANVSNLDLDTTYYYQIESGSVKSKINQFKTAKTTKTTFGVLCDTQASGSNFQYSDQLVEKLASINNDINFFMIAGDIVDRGGYEAQWTNFDTYMPKLNGKYLQATIPGNHELYHSNASDYVDESIYNEYYNNPKNGPAERPNSTYFFKYNNILFIMLDTMQRSNGNNLYDEQIAWFKQVVMNNPADFIIVVTHPGCYSAGAYTSDASIMKSKWRNVFEEYGVDLAISGHEHLYLRTKPLYQDKINEEKGLTYVIGGCAGAKHYSGKSNELFEVLLESDNPIGTYCGSIIEVINNELTMSYYDMYGNLRDTFKLTSRKTVDESFTPEDFIKSLKVTFNEKTKRNILSWDTKAYGIIKQINIYMTHLDATYERYVGPTSNEQAIGMGIPNRDYNYKITFYDYEGNEYKTEIDVINDQIALRPSDFKLEIVETTDLNYDFSFSYEDKGLSEISLELEYNNKTYSFDDNKKLTLTLDSEIDLNEIKINLLYDFYGEGSMAELTKDDVELTTNLLEHKNENEPINDNPPIEPNTNSDTPTNNNSSCKKGCKKQKDLALLVLSTISILGLSIMIYKKKK